MLKKFYGAFAILMAVEVVILLILLMGTDMLGTLVLMTTAYVVGPVLFTGYIFLTLYNELRPEYGFGNVVTNYYQNTPNATTVHASFLERGNLRDGIQSANEARQMVELKPDPVVECFYRDRWEQGFGYRAYCVLHNATSKHSRDLGDNRPCRAVDPD